MELLTIAHSIVQETFQKMEQFICVVVMKGSYSLMGNVKVSLSLSENVILL